MLPRRLSRFVAVLSPSPIVNEGGPRSFHGSRRASHTLLYRKYRGAPCTGTARVTLDRPWIVWNSRVDGIVVYSWYDHLGYHLPVTFESLDFPCEWFLGIFNFLEIFSWSFFLSFKFRVEIFFNFQNFLIFSKNGFLKDFSFLNFLIFLKIFVPDRNWIL